MDEIIKVDKDIHATLYEGAPAIVIMRHTYILWYVYLSIVRNKGSSIFRSSASL